MATDADGRTIATGDNMLAAATVRRIEGDNVVLVMPDGRVVRCTADQLLRVDDLATRGNSGYSPGRYFHTNAPASNVTPTQAQEFFRKSDVEASQATQDALFLAILAGYVPLSSVSSLWQGILGDTDRRTSCKDLGVAWIEEQQTSGSQVGASSTAWHELFSFTIPGNSLGTSGRAVIDFNIEGRSDSGSTKARWIVNGTDVYDKSGGVWGTDATAKFLCGQAVFAADGSTGAQCGYWWNMLSDQSTGNQGTGGHLWGDGRGSGQFDDTTDDSRSDITIAFEMGFATSDPDHYFKRRTAQLTLVPTTPA